LAAAVCAAFNSPMRAEMQSAAGVPVCWRSSTAVGGYEQVLAEA